MTTQSLTQVRCPDCGEDMTISVGVSHWEDGKDEDGRVVFRVRMESIEVIGGCDHAEDFRQNVVFVTEGGDV